MITQIKTPVQVIQELIAIHTIRAEAGERLNNDQLSSAQASKLATAAGQSKQFISELMEELSTFGDAVQGDVNRENDYHATWAKALTHIDTISGQQSAQVFEEMENKLSAIYQQYVDAETELPEAISKIITRQAAEIKQ